MTLTFAAIPTHNRHVLLTELVRQLSGTVDYLIIVDNASDPPIRADEMKSASGIETFVLHTPIQPPRLYLFWNMAFTTAQRVAEDQGQAEWNVAVLNDDTALPPSWATVIGTELRRSPAAIACGSEDRSRKTSTLKTQPARFPRMTPHAFIMKGEIGLRADERFSWWWGDTDLDAQAAMSGGVLIVPGNVATNRCANSTTVGKLAEQAGRDGREFAAKWGGRV